MALLGVGRDVDSPPICVNLMCSQRLDYALWCCLVLQDVFQHLGYLLALAYKPLSNLDSLEGSNMRGSFDSFLGVRCSSFTTLIPWRYRCCLLVWRFWWALLVPSSLFILVNFRIYRKECLATASNVPGSLVPAF